MCQRAQTTICNHINDHAMNLPLHTSIEKPRKSVRFNGVVHVAPFQRASMEEADDIWYSSVEIALMKAAGRDIAVSYRKLGAQQIEGGRYRGFEGYTFLRQRQRLLSNRCAVYAYNQGLAASIMSALYRQCNQWSCDIAYVQAMHDVVGAYGNDSKAIQQVNSIPSVTSILPPPDLPFAVEGFLMLQSQRKSKVERKMKRRSSTAGIRRVRQRIC